MSSSHGKRAAAAALAVAAGALAACQGSATGTTDVQVKGDQSRSIDARVGQEVVITLQTIGPGAYASPPSVSSGAVQFVSVRQASVAVPAGPTQEFRFQAVGTGTALVRFTHTDIGRPVEDTIRVH